MRLAVDDVEHAGRGRSGRLYAISTAGSLIGTMLSALVLIPLLGTQRTFLVFAWPWRWSPRVGLGWRFVARRRRRSPAAIALPVGTVKAADGRPGPLRGRDRRSSTSGWSRRDDGSRVLELNEGQAVHSLYRPGSYLTGDYWDGFLVLPFAGAAREPPQRIAILGNAGGTSPAPSATSSRAPRSTRSRSTPS